MEEDKSSSSNEEIEQEIEEESDNENDDENLIEKNGAEKEDNNSNKINEEELNIFSNKYHSIQKGINTLKSKFSSLIENIQKEDYELQYGLSFFESKQDMMIIYITNLLNYCYTKICGNQSISGMPIITDNIKIASLIERIKVIEIKLQHLINKTININNKDKNNIQTTNEMDLKPKILSIYNNSNEEEENEEKESESEGKKEKKKKNKLKTYMEKSELYKLKNKDVDFYETKTEQRNRKRQIERGKEKIRNSEMMRNLKNEMSDKPMSFDNNSNSYFNKYMKEVEEYEKDHFVNITVPKKVIKQLKRKDENVDDLYKIDSELKILSNTLNDSYNKKNKTIGNKKAKKFLNRKRKSK
jgi:hypothetical protein